MWLNIGVLAIKVFLEVLRISKRRCLIEISLEGAFHDGELALHARIPVVLDRVVGAALEDLGDLGPLVIHDAVHKEQDPLFFLVPVNFLDSWIQVIVPALATLLSYATIEVLRDECPLLRPVGDDEL